MAVSRRAFVKTCALAAGAGIVFPFIANAEEKRRGGKAAEGGRGDMALPFVEPGKEMAAAMNYQEKKSNIKDAALKADRQGVTWDKQMCSNCMLYTKSGDKGGAEVGKCSIFAGKLVKGSAWCASWAKKA